MSSEKPIVEPSAPPPWTRSQSAPRPPAGIPPWKPEVLELSDTDALRDDFQWRVQLASHAASQTLSLQRTEYYTRRLHTYVAIMFWLSIVAAIIGLILLGVIVAHTGDAGSSSSPY